MDAAAGLGGACLALALVPSAGPPLPAGVTLQLHARPGVLEAPGCYQAKQTPDPDPHVGAVAAAAAPGAPPGSYRPGLGGGRRKGKGRARPRRVPGEPRVNVGSLFPSSPPFTLHQSPLKLFLFPPPLPGWKDALSVHAK